MPVTAKQEEAGWLWRLTIEGSLDLRLPLTAFIGPPEPLPEPGTNRDDCWLCLYRPVAGEDAVEMVRQLKLVVYRQRRRRQARPPIVAKPSSTGDEERPLDWHQRPP